MVSILDICYSIGYMATFEDKDTLYNTILGIVRNLLETRENIKIESHQFYHNLWLIFMGIKQKFFFCIKKSKMADFSKWPIFQNRRFSKSPIGPWVSRIDWCKGHWCSSTYMVVNWRFWKTAILKNRPFWIFFLGFFFFFLLHSHENQSKFTW